MVVSRCILKVAVTTHAGEGETKGLRQIRILVSTECQVGRRGFHVKSTDSDM